jgi:hypothetical protein
MLLCHGVLHRADGDVDGISVYAVDRNVLFFRGLCASGQKLLHPLSTAIDGNSMIADHRHNVTAMLANEKLLLHPFFLPLKILWDMTPMCKV